MTQLESIQFMAIQEFVGSIIALVAAVWLFSTLIEIIGKHGWVAVAWISGTGWSIGLFILSIKYGIGMFLVCSVLSVGILVPVICLVRYVMEAMK